MFLLLKRRLWVEQIRLGHLAIARLVVALESSVALGCDSWLGGWHIRLLVQISGDSLRQLL